MNLYIYPNIVSQRYIDKVKDSIDHLINNGHKCFLSKQDCLVLYNDYSYCKLDIDKCDMIVTLGGDGTLLRAIDLALKYDKAICGINCGHLGYLCAFNYRDIDKYDLAHLHKKIFNLLEYDDGNTHYALNDIVIGKDYFGGTINLQVNINNIKKYSFIGDGLIVSTPIGSTAYNVSAGGIVLDLNDKKLAVTPICPHTKQIEPFVCDDDVEIEIELMKKAYKASIYKDGVLMSGLDKISIKLSDRKVTLLSK